MTAKKSAGSQDPGASPDGAPEYLVVGRIGRPHGVNGEVQFQVMTGFPERLQPGKQIFVGEDREVHTIIGIRGAENRRIFALDGIQDRDSAALLRNQLVYVATSEVPELSEGEFYYHELFGMRVETDEGELLGTLEEILETGANDVFVVRSADGQEFLLPVIEDVVLDIDGDKRLVLVHLIPGL